MTTREAFEELISKRGWYKDLGIPEGTAAAYKAYLKEGKITIDKMEEILAKAGYKVVTEKVWYPAGSSPLRRYMAFGLDKCENEGGMYNYIGDFETIVDATEVITNNYFFGHVFDTVLQETIIPDEYAK